MVNEEDTNPSGTRLARYLSKKTLKPFIYKDKDGGHFGPIICHKGDQKINGYEATILADICDAFLDARKKMVTIYLGVPKLINIHLFKNIY